MRERRQKNRILRAVLIALIMGLLLSGVILLIHGQVESVRSHRVAPDFDTVKTRRVLFLSSYSPTFPSLAAQRSGIASVLASSEIDYDIVYMDTKVLSRQEDGELFHTQMQQRLQEGGSYDGILCGDDEALNFVVRYREELFAGIPVVFFAVNDAADARAAGRDPLITGETERMYIGQTVNLARKLLGGKVKRIVSIYDDTAAGRGDYAGMQRYEKRHPEFRYEAVNASALTRAELGKRLERIGENTIVLYLSAAQDKSGNIYSVTQASRFIADHTDVPVFRPCGGGFGSGITGGMVMDFRGSARRMAQVMKDHLEGKRSIETVPVSTTAAGKLVFDEEAMERFGIARSELPENVEIQGEKLSLFEQDPGLAVPFVMIVSSLAALVVFIGWELRAARRGERAITYASEHDPLTGLANRESCSAHALSLLRHGHPLSILLLDIDDLKDINNAYGHTFGDELIRRFGQQLSERVGLRGGLAYRYGGDEFLVLLQDVRVSSGGRMARELMELPKKSLPQDVPAEGGVSVSVGIRNLRDVPQDLEQEIANAEIAMYQAKHQGKNQAVVFDRQMRERMQENNRIKELLLDAMDNDGLYLAYQPKVATADCSISGLEGLVRMKGQSISPQIFIGIAEECGWVRRIGRIVTALCIRQIARWRDEGKTLVPVSINYSAGQLVDTGYVDFLEEFLRRYQVDPRYVVIEITESLYMERAGRALRLFEGLERIGVKISLDDFGRGYTNFSYLAYIPSATVKIDKSIIDSYLGRPGGEEVIADIIHLSHTQGKRVVAEGVEEREQFLALRRIGCDYIQGYYFSRPVSADEVMDLDFTDLRVRDGV